MWMHSKEEYEILGRLHEAVLDYVRYRVKETSIDRQFTRRKIGQEIVSYLATEYGLLVTPDELSTITPSQGINNDTQQTQTP